MRVANTEDELALLLATWNSFGNLEALTSLLQRGVSPNIYEKEVCKDEK